MKKLGLLFFIFGVSLGKIFPVDFLFVKSKNNLISEEQRINQKETAQEMFSAILECFNTKHESNACFRILSERFVLKFPDYAISKINGKEFLREEGRKKYVNIIFSALAKYYPEKFSDAALLLENKESREIAFRSFFQRLIHENVKLANDLFKNEYIIDLFSENGLHVLFEFLRNESDKAFLNVTDDSVLTLLDNDEVNHAIVLSLYAMQFDRSNYQNAIRWANEYLDGDQKIYFIKSLIDHLCSNGEFNICWEIVKSTNMTNEKGLMNSLIDRTILQDALLGLEMVEAFYVGSEREKKVGEVLQAINKKLPPEEMLSIINLLPEGVSKDAVLPNFFEKYYILSPKEALSWAALQENKVFIRQSIQNLISNGDLFSVESIVPAVLNQKIGENVFLESVPSEIAQRDTYLALSISRHLNSDIKEDFTNVVFSRWMYTDPESVAYFLENNPDSNFSEEEIASVLKNVASYSSLESMTEFLNSLNNSEKIDFAVDGLISVSNEEQIEAVLSSGILSENVKIQLEKKYHESHQ